MTVSPTNPKTRVFTSGRIVALALIGLVVLGLGYLRFAPDAGSVSVPKGAHAGQLTLHACKYGTDKGSYAADCGTLVVPENRADPKSRLIALPVTRIRARSQRPGVPIFRLEGGPGLTNMKFSKASRFAANHDVILVGYRGIDGSVRLDCPEVESSLKHSTDFLGEKSFRSYGDALRSCAHRLTAHGVDLAAYGLTQQVEDLEAARIALGYKHIDLLSESAGTRTAMIYAWRHPSSIHRSVMIGVNPPGNFLWNAKATDEQIRKYSAHCALDDACRRRTDNLAASIRRATTDIPDHWFFLPIKQGNARIASFYGLMESTSEAAPLSAPMVLNTLLSADDGDASGLWFQSLLADFALPTSFVWGQMAAAARADADTAERYFASGDHRAESILGNPGARFIWGDGELAKAWPASADENEYDKVRTSRVSTLLIGGALDGATPPQIATRELLPYLPNGHQVVLPGVGHTTSFWTEQPEASSHLINTFLDSGRVDESFYKPTSVDFTPEVTQTALAKGIAGGMVGFALVAVLSLLWMARRLHTRGHFGRKAGATLRSFYPIVLGLGGWFLGVLIVVTTLPGTPLDNELLATLSVGVPIGLGVCFGWANRDWSVKIKTTGFAMAGTGALLGAWLGFSATTGLLALITAILGATAGANLALLALDIGWDRQARDRFAASTATEALEPQPMSG
jgi:pimeloyl-ACP methyl ester carboxylesterase